MSKSSRIAYLLTLSMLLAGPGIAQGPYFEDVSERLGTDFMRLAAPFGGSGFCGLAWLDADGDRDLDLFVTNGPGGNGLFLNDGTGHFENHAAAAGVDVAGAFHSAAVAGDIDNDGWEDIVATPDNLGPFPLGDNVVFHNRGGLFEATPDPAVAGFPSSGSSVLLDYDRDGDLDLYVTGGGTIGMPESGGLIDAEGNPVTWDARMDSGRLFRNLGALGFEEVTLEAGLFKRLGPCAVASSDFDENGWPDLMVANCNTITEGPVGGNCPPGLTCPVCAGPSDPGPCRPEGSGGNPLASAFSYFRNNGDGTFTDLGEDPETGLSDILGFFMAVAPGDIDNDGDIDIFATNVGVGFAAVDPEHVPHALIRNDGVGDDGKVRFTSITDQAGLGIDEAPHFGWGASLFDVDNDSDLDLFYAGSLPPFLGVGTNPGWLFLNDGTGRFTPAEIGIDLTSRFTTGVAAADFDGDGFTDVVVGTETTAFGPDGTPLVPERPVLLRNRAIGGNAVQVKAIGTASNRDAVGARLKFYTSQGERVREIYAGTSFISSESKIVSVGVGSDDKVNVVDVYWPSGFRNRFFNLKADRITRLPELACNFDEPEGDFQAYMACVLDSLLRVVDDGIVNLPSATRFLIQAVRAWNSAH